MRRLTQDLNTNNKLPWKIPVTGMSLQVPRLALVSLDYYFDVPIYLWLPDCTLIPRMTPLFVHGLYLIKYTGH